MRAVIDTNILVRAMLNPGGSVGPVVDLLRDGRYVYLYSQATLDEVIDVLGRPRMVNPEQVPGHWRKPKRHAAAQRPDPAASPPRIAGYTRLFRRTGRVFGCPRDTRTGSNQKQIRSEGKPPPSLLARSVKKWLD
jgi:PIN domain